MDDVRKALEAAWRAWMTDPDDAMPDHQQWARERSADAIAAFLRALPMAVVHYRETSKPAGAFGSTPTMTGADLAAAVEAAKEDR